MTPSPPLPVEIVSQTSRLEAAVLALAGEREIAVDTESNSFYRYPEQMCLIQIAGSRNIYIIDTIVLTDIAPLKKVFEDSSVRKVIHGADYDIRTLDRHYGFRVRNLYDTSIAARFTGVTRFGLGDLLQDSLGITIDKCKRLQRADWGRRPLSAEELDYASADVFHLLKLHEVLELRLKDLGRTAWVAEECARLEEVKYTPADPETAYLAVTESRNLDGRGLAVLRSLVQFREEEARRQHRPHFFIMPDSALVFLAANPAADLRQVPGLGQNGLQRYGRGLRQALDAGIAAPPIKRPVVVWERLSPAQSQRLGRLKAWRTSQGAALCLDPSLLYPAASLERLAKAPETLEGELNSPEVRNWQREQFGASLRAFVKSIG